MRQKRDAAFLRPLRKLPRIFVALAAIEKILCFARLAEGEINGLGIVERRGNDFIITDAFILEQKANFASAEIDPFSLNQFVANYERPEQLKCQWHSHVAMDPFFSSEDESTIAGYATDYMISIIVNKKYKYACRLDLYRPFRAVFNMKIEVLLSFTEDLEEFCRTEIKRKVRLKPFDALADLFRYPNIPVSIPLDAFSCGRSSAEEEEHR